jgi:hypothetical protein
MSTNKTDATFELDISVQDNTLIVGENGGNVTGGAGDTVSWRAGDQVPHFTLQFFRLAAESKSNSGDKPVNVVELSSWPFSEPAPPPSGIVGPTRFFCGKLAPNIPPATAFKYTVTVGNLQLDPIVIFDR